jgi:transposase-like protein
MPNAVRKQLTGRGPVGKTAVVGAKDRATNQVAAKTVPATDKQTLQGFVKDHADRQARVYTDEARAYETLPFEHESVKHSVSEYVRGQAHTNGVESFWSMLKRGYYGTFHKLSPKHLDRYVQEFAGRHNLREQDTIDMMGAVVLGMDGKRLKYTDLIRDNGLDSGARG